MAGFLSGKMKRKDLEEVHDEFSEFSLSSPARKIRRLDAELPPIMEEEEPAAPILFEQQPELGLIMTEAELPSASNEERALVLYKPVDAPFLQSSSSSNFSFKVNSDFIRDLKNQALWPGHQNQMTDKFAANNSLAVVPWVASQSSFADHGLQNPVSIGRSLEDEQMEAEAEGSTSMEVENNEEQAGNSAVGGDGLHQWQQHCMIHSWHRTHPALSCGHCE